MTACRVASRATVSSEELDCVRICSDISSIGRVVSQGRQERGAGMAEIIFELRLIFPWPLADAVILLG